MSMRGSYLIGMLVLLFVANICMLMGMTNWPRSVSEGFATDFVKGGAKKSGAVEGMDNIAPYDGLKWGKGSQRQGVQYRAGSSSSSVTEYFTDSIGSNFGTAPIGTYDGLNVAANLPPASGGWRGTSPNVPLAGPPVEIGPDNLFYFKNNECKPECCGATLSCDGGCVCTTPEQRDFINTRGGNRKHDDGF
jgi:hypothetical protein